MTRLVIIVVRIGLPSKDPTAEDLLLDVPRTLSGTSVTGPSVNIQSPYSNSGSKEHHNIKSIQRTRSRDVPSGHMVVLVGAEHHPEAWHFGDHQRKALCLQWKVAVVTRSWKLRSMSSWHHRGSSTCGCVDVILDGVCGAVQSPARRWADHRCTCASVLGGKSDSCRVHRRACSSWYVDAQDDARMLPGALLCVREWRIRPCATFMRSWWKLWQPMWSS